MTSTEPPTQAALKEGISAVLGIALQDTDLTHAVGESGVLEARVSLRVEHGRVIWTKAAVAFERRMSIGGNNGR